MHQTQIAKMERGMRPTRIAEATAIAEIFHAPISALLYADTNQEPPSGGLRGLRAVLECAFDDVSRRIDQDEKELMARAGAIARLRADQVGLANSMKEAGIRTLKADDVLTKAGLLNERKDG